MTQFNRIAFALFTAFLPIFTFAQIQKGSYNFGGDVRLTSASLSSKSYKSKSVNLNFSPSVSKFLTNNWLVGVQPILSSSNFKADYANFRGNDDYYISSNSSSVGLGISSRYYWYLSPKVSLFALAGMSYEKNKYSFSTDGVISGTSEPEYSFNYNEFRYKAGFGLNVALKSDVFLEANLTYQKSEVSNFSEQFGNRFFSNSEVMQLNIGLNHFIFDLKLKSGTASEYLKKGRQIVGGNISINRIRNSFSGYVMPEFGHFITENLLISTKLNYFNTSSKLYFYDGAETRSLPTKNLAASVGVRYYIPLKERLFIHPEFIYTNQIAGGNTHKHVANFNIGGSYFLSKNVAIEANLLQSRFYLLSNDDTETQNLSSALGLGSVGLRYFIR